MLFLKHGSSILRQSSNPVVHGRAKPALRGPNSTEPNLFIMEKPHAGLDDCLNMLLSCFRKRRSVLRVWNDADYMRAACDNCKRMRIKALSRNCSLPKEVPVHITLERQEWHFISFLAPPPVIPFPETNLTARKTQLSGGGAASLNRQATIKSVYTQCEEEVSYERHHYIKQGECRAADESRRQGPKKGVSISSRECGNEGYY